MIKLQAKRLLNVLLIAICLLTSQACAVAESGSGLHFTILHTNDLHAHDEPYLEHGRTIGGMSRITHLIRSIRAKDPNVLTIDAGDIFQGTPFFKQYHGATEVEMLNDAGYNIYTIGNHEFDDGAANLAEQLKKAKFDIISANMDASAVPALQSEVKPSVVKTINGEKVGFIGAIVPNITEMSLGTQGVKPKATGDNWADPIKAEVERLKSEGVDKIVLVTHVGVELDKQLAQIPDVDVIVGGHSHTRLDKPIVVDHPDGSKCIIVQTGCYGKALGKLDLAFDSKGRLNLAETNYHLINVTDRIYQEKDIQAYLAEKAKPFAALRNTVLAVAQQDMEKSWRQVPWDSALGDLIADALAEGGKKYGATISFQNRGGIRSSIDQGTITQEKVEEILPFENHLIVATIKGEVLKNVLEHSVDKVSDYSKPNSGPIKGVEGLGSKFLDVHGLKFAYDPSAQPGSRVAYAFAQDKDGNWSAVKPGNDYRIAINDYSFKGGEGFDFSSAKDIVDTKTRLSVFFHDYLLKQKTLKAVQPTRIVPVLGSVAGLDLAHPEALVVRYRDPGSRIYVISGTDLGVAPGVGQLPVPLENPKMVASAVGKADGKEIRLALPTFAADKKSTKHYFAALVVSPKKSVPALISEPVLAK